MAVLNLVGSKYMCDITPGQTVVVPMALYFQVDCLEKKITYRQNS